MWTLVLIGIFDDKIQHGLCHSLSILALLKHSNDSRFETTRIDFAWLSKYFAGLECVQRHCYWEI